MDQAHGVRYFNEATIMPQLTRGSGGGSPYYSQALLVNKAKKGSDKNKGLGERVGQTYFLVVLCLNQTGIKLQEAC